MLRSLFPTAVFATLLFATGTLSAQSSAPAEPPGRMDVLPGFTLPPMPTTPTWSRLRGTTLVYDAMRWAIKPSRIPGFRTFMLLSFDDGAIGVSEGLAPVDGAAPASLLATMEVNQRNQFLLFEEASARSPLKALLWPSGGACGHFWAQMQGGMPAWYSHCFFIHERQPTYLNVVVTPRGREIDVAAINEVLATLRPRTWRALEGFHTLPLAEIDGMPIRLRLPVRFGRSKSRFASDDLLYCDRDDAAQFGEYGPDDIGACVGILTGTIDSYSPQTDRFNDEDRIEAMGGRINGMPFSHHRRTIQGRPALELTMTGADHLKHMLLVAHGERVVHVNYTEPTGIGAEGYDAIWPELLKGLDAP